MLDNGGEIVQLRAPTDDATGTIRDRHDLTPVSIELPLMTNEPFTVCHKLLQLLEAKRAGARSHIETLLQPLAADAALVTVLDGHSATLSWLGAVSRRSA